MIPIIILQIKPHAIYIVNQTSDTRFQTRLLTKRKNEYIFFHTFRSILIKYKIKHHKI